MLDFIDFSFLDVLDVLLVAILIYYIYKLLRGTVAINIFIGIALIFMIWQMTELLKMEMLSNILVVVRRWSHCHLLLYFNKKYEKFLLMIGTTNVASRRNFLKQINFLKSEIRSETDTDIILKPVKKLSTTKTGALIVMERTNSLDFLINTGDAMNAQVNIALLESIFYKNSPLHMEPPLFAIILS